MGAGASNTRIDQLQKQIASDSARSKVRAGVGRHQPGKDRGSTGRAFCAVVLPEEGRGRCEQEQVWGRGWEGFRGWRCSGRVPPLGPRRAWPGRAFLRLGGGRWGLVLDSRVTRGEATIARPPVCGLNRPEWGAKGAVLPRGRKKLTHSSMLRSARRMRSCSAIRAPSPCSSSRCAPCPPTRRPAAAPSPRPRPHGGGGASLAPRLCTRFNAGVRGR